MTVGYWRDDKGNVCLSKSGWVMPTRLVFTPEEWAEVRAMVVAGEPLLAGGRARFTAKYSQWLWPDHHPTSEPGSTPTRAGKD